MKLLFILAFFLSPIENALTMQKSISADSSTIIFVRHAEKVDDGTANPQLNEEGQKRAQNLKEILTSEYEISAIYSTNYHRTGQTAAPIAAAVGKEVLHYGMNDPEGLMKEIIKQYPGKTVLILGHSNTTVFFANLLLGQEKFQQIDEEDYGNIYVLKAAELGKAKAIHFTY